jgi:hypothetical protein
MSILDVLLRSQNGEAVRQLGDRFGLPPEKAQSAVAALVPALAAGLQRNVSQQGGLDGLLNALASGDHERYLDDPSTLNQPETTEDGNGILGHVFGSKDVSRQVAQRASERTGIGVNILKQMLPVVAAMVMGGLSRNAGTNMDVDAEPAAATTRGAGIISLLTPLLDRNQDGSVIDDVIGMAGGILGRRSPTA